MKTKKVLVWSLVANVVLAGFVAFIVNMPPSRPNAALENSPATTNLPHGLKDRRTALSSNPSSEDIPPRQLRWSEIESPDYKTYIARLRAIDCPEQTIRDIITTKLNKITASGRAAIRRGGQEFVYWKPDVEDTDYYPKLRKERALESQKRALLKELFGFDPNEVARRESGTYDYLEWQYDFLTGEKREKVREIQEASLDRGRELKSPDPSNPDAREKVRGLYDQRLVDLAAVLTPAEVEEYDLCSSSLSESMRNNLDGFNPTADEFRKIYRVKKNGGSDAEIQQLLGDERYAQYRRVQDYSYRETYRFALARDLSPDVVDKVWEIRNATRELSRDPNLTKEQRVEMTREALVKVMGEKNYNLYSRSAGALRIP